MIENTQQINQLTGEQAELLTQLKINFVDLASERTGGEALSCSDDFFAGMDNLLKAGRGIFIDDKYTDRGKWMDGWESRRSYGREFRLNSGIDYDWCIIRLGMRGRIKGFDIDTNFFRGNAPQFVAVEACDSPSRPDENTIWTEILSKIAVEAHSQNIIKINTTSRWTHVRLKMYPDGGIARFRVYGEVEVDWSEFRSDELIDLAFIKNGGKALLVSDMFFSDKNNLIMPGRGKDMGDGWETKRRRDPGPDWSIVKLGSEGIINKVIIDTCHFKGNFPNTFMLEGLVSDDDDFTNENCDRNWQTIIAQTNLQADKEHHYSDEIISDRMTKFTHVRLSIFPDGGISRMRILGYKG
jgi:allantoicase